MCENVRGCMCEDVRGWDGSAPVRPTFFRQTKQRFLLGVVLAPLSPSLSGDGAVRSDSSVVCSSAWSHSA